MRGWTLHSSSEIVHLEPALELQKVPLGALCELKPGCGCAM